jgi:TatD DNase family protein
MEDYRTSGFDQAAVAKLAAGELFANKKGKVMPYTPPAYPLVDTHAHLTIFDTLDPAYVLTRAKLAGVQLIVAPLDPTDDTFDVPYVLASLAQAQATSRQQLQELAAAGAYIPSYTGYELPPAGHELLLLAGVHPYGAGAFGPAARERLEALLASDLCCGVGEIGLDYTCDIARERQRAVFEEQLAIAAMHNCCVELHLRSPREDVTSQAHQDALAVVKASGINPWLVDVHCYTSNREVVEPWVELGCHIAFGGAVTFTKSDDIREACLAVPLEQLLTETDCPYMAPVPLRGLECEPAMVGVTTEFMCDLYGRAHGLAPQEVGEALWNNAWELYLRSVPLLPQA